MARIPQYSRSVTPQNTPYEYVRSNANPTAFGAGVYEAGQNLGNSMLAMSDSMATLKANYDKTKLLEMSNYIDNWSNENLYDKDKGYFNKTGKEAMGKSPEIMDSYDKYADEYISKAGFTGGYNVQARRIVQQKRNSIEYHVMSHDKRETDRWQDAVYTDAMNNVYTKAIKGRNDANEIQKYYSDGEIIFDNYAALKGWDKDEETKNIMKKEYNANFHGKVLDALLADGSLQSEKYFNEHKEDFSPEVQNKYAQRIHTETINYTARTIASGLVSKSPTEAYQEIDKIENIDLRNAVENEYNRSLRQQESIKRITENQLLDEFYQKAYTATQNGGSLSQDDIPEGLDPKTKLSLMSYINSNGQPETDDQIWETLYNMSVNNAQGFAKENLNKYRGYLSEGEYKSFLKKQQDIRNGGYYTVIKDDDAKINAALEAIGLDRNGWKERTRDIAFTEIKSLTHELEARKGRKITENELYDLINSLGYQPSKGMKLYQQLDKSMNERTGFIRDVINDFTYYQSKHNGELPSDEDKMKIINRRASSVIIQQNDGMKNSISQPRQAKVGDIWQGHIITSTFGSRSQPTQGATTDHKGIDLAYKNNEIFSAYASGTVDAVGRTKELGNYVDIKSADGTIHRYGHANAILVKKGDKINAGDRIGRAGSTGISTGPHVHYAKLVKNQFVNPLDGSPMSANSGGDKGWAF